MRVTGFGVQANAFSDVAGEPSAADCVVRPAHYLAPEHEHRVDWTSPEQARGVVTLPGSVGPMDVVRTPEGECVIGRIELGGWRFSAMTPDRQVVGVFYPLDQISEAGQPLRSGWREGANSGGPDSNAFTAERSRFYLYALDIGLRQSWGGDLLDRMFRDHAVLQGGRDDFTPAQKSAAWGALIEGWRPLEEPDVLHRLDRLIAEQPGRAFGHSPQASALAALRRVLVAYPHFEDSLRDVIAQRETSIQWWAQKAQIEAPIVKQIADQVSSREKIERERGLLNRCIAEVIDTLHLHLPGFGRVELSLAVYALAREREGQRELIASGGFMPTPGMDPQDVSKTIESLISTLQPTRQGRVVRSALGVLAKALPEPRVSAALVRFFGASQRWTAATRALTLASEREWTLRKALNDLREQRVAALHDDVTQTIRDALSRIAPVVPPGISPEALEDSFEELHSQWLMACDDKVWATFQPAVSPATGLADVIEMLTDDVEANPDLAPALMHVQAQMQNEDNILHVESIRHALYRERQGVIEDRHLEIDCKILDEAREEDPVGWSIARLTADGPAPFLAALLESSGRVSQSFQRVLAQREHVYNLAYVEAIKDQGPRLGEFIKEEQTRIGRMLDALLDQDGPIDGAEPIARAVALLRALIDRAGGTAFVQRDVAITSLLFNKNLPPLGHALARWQGPYFSQAANEANQIAKDAAQWFFSEFEPDTWRLLQHQFGPF